MAKAKARTIKKERDPRAVVDVECISNDCWTSGGFLAPGDKAKIVAQTAEGLEVEGKVKILD